jgi:hypothetical protein
MGMLQYIGCKGSSEVKLGIITQVCREDHNIGVLTLMFLHNPSIACEATMHVFRKSK